MTENKTDFVFGEFKPVINTETGEVSFIVLDSPDEIDVFIYSNPTIRDRQKNGLTNNPASFGFYKKLDELSEMYPSNKFYRVKGNIFGKKEDRLGHIVCTKDISQNVKNYLESYKLKRKGQNVEYYKLERYTSLDDVPDKILAEIIRMISRKHATKV